MHSRLRAILAVLLVLWPQVLAPSAVAADAPQVIVALDLSGSMRGQRLEAAKFALVDLAKRADSRLQIGIVTFNSQARVALAPTLDRPTLIQSIEALTAEGKTSLFDGVKLALDTLTSKNSMVLAVCDGEDNFSSTLFTDLLQTASAKGVAVSAIAIRPSGVQRDLLRTLTNETGGKLIAVDELTSLLEFLPRELVQPTVTASASPAPDRLVATGTPSVAERNFALAVVVGLGAMVVLFVVALLARDARRKRRAVLATVGLPTSKADQKKESFLDSLWNLWENRIAFLRRILEDAGISISLRDWMTRQVATFVIADLLFFILVKEVFSSLVFAVVLTLFLSVRSISRSRMKISRAFEAELHSALLVAASSLRAGLSFNQALENLSKEGQGEVPRQLRRALAEVQIGSTMEDALYRVADRVRSQDLRWVVAALAIQREVGGSLATVLMSTAEMIQNRFALVREVRTLSAEGRSSAQVLIALPIFLFLYFYVTSRQYISALWSSAGGFLMLGAIVLLEVLGWLWIRKVVEVKV